MSRNCRYPAMVSATNLYFQKFRYCKRIPNEPQLRIAAMYIYCWQVSNLWHIRIISSHISITVELHRMASCVRFQIIWFLWCIILISWEWLCLWNPENISSGHSKMNQQIKYWRTQRVPVLPAELSAQTWPFLSGFHIRCHLGNTVSLC